MMPRGAGWLVAAVQMALLCVVGAGYLADRSRMPHVWLATRPYDPELPVRGRYVRLTVLVNVEAAPDSAPASGGWRARLLAHDGKLFAQSDASGNHWVRPCGTPGCWVLAEPVAYFLPEHAPDPSRLAPGESLWVEATIPPRGPPRPLRLGRLKDGQFTLIDTD